MIVILKGGPSPEAEISRKSAESITRALTSLGYNTIEMEFDENCVKKLIEIKPEKVFIALHGVPGEDGSVQGLLETIKIPYTGCNVETSAICIDKDTTKRILKTHGIPVPAGRTFYKEDKVEWLEFPCVVKPARTGSTVGISLVKKKEELNNAVELAFKYDSKILIEEYIEGRELTIPVLNGKPLPIVEIVTESGFYDYNSKYKSSSTQYKVPAKISEKVREKIEKIAIKTFKVLECRGAIRIDFRLNSMNIPYLLEVNTIPGMTERSLLPKSAAAAGISFEQLIEEILNG
ncbi:D-alanine--D-alanine ligase family protein [Desulfurobacterium atlanticum]|uniref:D-alanine--D-alanine ligase n=1 Tax=Desulfurobacterium atlanticum TaxID=240169 RepID=A0A238YFA5_9BACT|nr:D-alanine--D-alanine ligase [Desulfurobacterium atlanticum]SNR69740.1 D-alanine-D-alanine ligase [Desulfurobacterium atlanticum]